ncbi:MAG: hypothetical protein JW950_05080 [Deltaproteobacteria bacterium]|nr:hypothetical protein [Deltaproteobacteria bacterium]
MAPLAYLAHRCRGRNAGGKRTSIIVYAGARNAQSIVGIKHFEAVDLRICTDDGSRGFHGPVTALFERDLCSYDPEKTMIYACGPPAMIGSLARILEATSFSCQVSMEERMACGVGACLGCVTAVKDNGGRIRYERVCREGPVFDIRDLAGLKTDPC